MEGFLRIGRVFGDGHFLCLLYGKVLGSYVSLVKWSYQGGPFPWHRTIFNYTITYLRRDENVDIVFGNSGNRHVFFINTFFISASQDLGDVAMMVFNRLCR